MVARPKKDAPEQSRIFIKAAREAGCSEDEAVFDRTIKTIAKPKDKGARKKGGLKPKK